MKIRNILLTCSLALCGSVGVVSAIAINTPRPIEVKADIPSGMYNSAESAVASNDMPALFSALKTVANTNFHSVGYDGLFDVYALSDVLSGGKLKDWYSEVTNFTVSTKRCGNYSSEGDCWNREHSIPKSWWGGSTSNQGCDAFIVVPTDGKVNGMRSNYPFGEVSSASYTSQSGCKLGSSKVSVGADKVFEPYDSMKGDFARASLYATVKWSTTSWTSGNGSTTFQSSNDMSHNFGLTNYAKDLFYRWHKLDPVDSFEIARNNGVMNSSQGNRNPFIDHPEYADYLWGGVTPETQDVQTLTVSPISVSLIYGGTQQLTPTITPSNASKSVTYTSSNTSVATVSESGLITAGNTAGSATITVRSNKTTDKYATCEVTVSAPTPVAVTGVTAEDILVTEGGSLQINASYTPSNAYPVPTISYTSSDTSIATVSNTGLVTGVSVGDTTISIVASQSTGASVSKVINVTVEESKGWAQANSISAGEQVVFGNKSSGSVAGAFNSSYLNSVSGSVWQDSLITSLAADATIWTVGGTSGAYTFTNQSGQVLYGNGKSLSVDSGNSTWSVSFSSGSATMTAGSDGKPLCYNTGSPRYKTYDASSSTLPLVEIYKGGSAPASDYVTIDKTSMALTTGDTGTISVTSSSGTVTWSSSNTAVATVTNGTVTAVSAGSATITATCGTATATCAVSVSAPVGPSVSLNKGSLSLTVGGSETLVATTTGSGTLTWSSSNSSVATVSSGTVTAVASGSATITASYGGASATCSVTVSEPSAWKGVTITKSNSQLTTTASTAEDTKTYAVVDASGAPVGSNFQVKWGVGSNNHSSYDEITVVKNTGAITGLNDVKVKSITVDYYQYENFSIYSGTTKVTGEQLSPSGKSNSLVKKYSIDSFDWHITNTSSYNQNFYSLEFELDISAPVEDYVHLDKNSIIVEEGKTSTITASASGTVTWTSSNSSIASVANGVVTGVAEGNATITATCGTATATCAVTVIKEAPAPVSSSYDIEFAKTADGSTDLTSDGIIGKITKGAEYVTSFSSISKVYEGSNGLKFGSGKAAGTFTMTPSSTVTSASVVSITLTTAAYGSDTGLFQLSVNGSVVKSDISPAAGSTEVTLSSATSITSIKIETTAKRAYLAGISFNVEGGSSTYNAENFASDFLTNVSCDVTGQTAPTLSKTWAQLKALFNSIEDSSEVAKLTGATYTVSGSGSSTVVTPTGTTTNTIAQAMYRYDYIIAKYGTTDYENFITGRVSPISSLDVIGDNSVDSETLPLIVLVSAIGLTAVGGYFFIKKRKENI